MTASMSVRSVVACRSSARITAINSPSTVTTINIKNSNSGSPGSSELKPTYSLVIETDDSSRISLRSADDPDHEFVREFQFVFGFPPLTSIRGAPHLHAAIRGGHWCHHLPQLSG
jgi:hypothetical protein